MQDATHRARQYTWLQEKVMLISATPMNNTPADIYNEIQLFQDPRRCTIDGVANLTAFFSPLIKEFQQLRKIRILMLLNSRNWQNMYETVL